MKSENCDPELFFALEEEKEGKKENKANEIEIVPLEYEKFVKMLKMGVPKEAVSLFKFLFF